MRSSGRNLIIALFLCVVSIQYAVFFGFKYLDRTSFDLDGDPTYSFPIHGQDSPQFVSLADNLSKYHKFSLDGVQPETFRTPGYPALIFLSQSIFGGVSGAVFVQIILSGLSAILIFLIAQKIFGQTVAIISALVFSLSPSAIFHSVVLLSDMAFVFFILLSIYLLFFADSRIFKVMFLAGISLGLSTLFRPISLYLPLILIPFLLYEIRHQVTWKRALSLTGMFVVGLFVIVSPWLIRNRLETGVFAFSSLGVYNLASYNIPDFLASKYGPASSIVSEYQKIFRALPSEKARSLEYSSELKNIFWPYLKGDFVSYGVYHIIGTAKFFLSSNLRYLAIQINAPKFKERLGLFADSPDILSALVHKDFSLVIKTLRTQTLITFDRLLMIAVTFLAFAAIFIRKHRFYSLLFLAIILYFALLTGPVSIPRYRLPAEPFLIILMLFTITHILSGRNHGDANSSS
ncbi:hypothetical protein EPN83_00575 [Patescibacteria group bacterium]|nr:MAG: hypothetical protein EPN83_00575 [Patescibacteria group bacterium]